MRVFTLITTSALLVPIFLPFGSAVMRFVLDEEITNCGNEDWMVDLTNFKLIIVNDTTTVANGTCILLTAVNTPWKLNFYGEQYERGHWMKKFERNFQDFCKNILKPGELWYDPFNKKLKGKQCPYNKNQIFPADEDTVYFDVSYMPPTFQGRWRFTIDGDLGCFRVRFDFVDF
ncbi:hypothetical protein ACKWTF_013566 [Chironomus riparius]